MTCYPAPSGRRQPSEGDDVQQSPDRGALGVEVAHSLHAHWPLYLIEAIVLGLLGAATILRPPLATLVVTMLNGWLVLISGLFGLFTTLEMRHAPSFLWSLLSAVLGIAVGFVLPAIPLTGAFSLTVVPVAFFLIEGGASIMFALDHKREWSGC